MSSCKGPETAAPRPHGVFWRGAWPQALAVEPTASPFPWRAAWPQAWRWSPPHLHSPGEAPGRRRGGGGAHRISIPLENRLASGVAAVEPTASPFPWRGAWPQAWAVEPTASPPDRGRWSPPHLHQTSGGAHRISTRPRAVAAHRIFSRRDRRPWLRGGRRASAGVF